MSWEENFTAALGSAAELAPEPEPNGLADAAERRGRQRRRNRRATVLGGAAAVAATVLAVGSGLIGPGGVAGIGGPGGRPAARVSDAYMRDTLAALMPAGQVRNAHGWGRSNTGNPVAALEFEGANGPGRISLDVRQVSLPITAGTEDTQCADPFGEPVESCTRTTRRDGSILVVYVLLPRQQGMSKSLTAVHTRADGEQVRLDAFDPDGGQGVALTADQAVAVVTSSAWDRASDGVRPTDAPRPGVSSPAPSALLATLTGLLPAGATADQAGAPQSTPGVARVKVTFEGRASWLSVTVWPHWGQEGKDDPRQVFEAAGGQGLTHTADGTGVITRADGASKGGGGPTLTWGVDTLHPDGTRVDLSEWNGPNGYAFEPGTPALSVEQLTALATARDWRTG
ncbi:hypothetical protein [Kitasatospora sp. NPDC059571]|uniref:hypothetical protein n=1 Tax=Kitasatospora sp. NPDC059571 TaxID=3346871 RepID=UPI00367912B8